MLGAPMQVHKAAKSWEALPNITQSVQQVERLRAMRRKSRVLRAAAAAGAPVPSAAGTAAVVARPAAAAATATAAARATTGAISDSDSDDGLECTGEVSTDEMLRMRRDTAVRAGMMIDLSAAVEEADVEQATAELAAAHAKDKENAQQAEWQARLSELRRDLVRFGATAPHVYHAMPCFSVVSVTDDLD
jgi:hypothetical protein